MVSAVFHSPLEASLSSPASHPSPSKTSLTPAVVSEAAVSTPQLPQAPKLPYDWHGLWLKVLPPFMGLGLLIGVWALVSITTSSSIPSPYDTFLQAVDVFRDPFYQKGPNDQGVGWNILSSLKRVAIGFGLAAVVGIPFGFVIGRFEFMSRMFNPLISLLRPVSPLAWLPIGLMVF